LIFRIDNFAKLSESYNLGLYGKKWLTKTSVINIIFFS